MAAPLVRPEQLPFLQIFPPELDLCLLFRTGRYVFSCSRFLRSPLRGDFRFTFPPVFTFQRICFFDRSLVLSGQAFRSTSLMANTRSRLCIGWRFFLLSSIDPYARGFLTDRVLFFPFSRVEKESLHFFQIFPLLLGCLLHDRASKEESFFFPLHSKAPLAYPLSSKVERNGGFCVYHSLLPRPLPFSISFFSI